MPSLAREDLSRVGRSFQVVGVISLGHFFSHFYYLVLPPLFPLLKQALEVDYTSLGLAITAYSIVAALAQAPIGFVVDRFNPALVLAAGLTLCSLSVMAVGVFPHYGALIVFMLLLGLGDSVFHPADYVILSRSVESHQTGRAFSAHAFAGHLGFAAAPVTVLTLTSWFGWRAALVVCGVGGLLVAVIVLFKRHLLSGSRSPVTPTREGGESPGGGGMAVLLSWPMVLGLVFFVGISLSGTGVRDFGVSTLHLLYQAPLAQAGTVISAFLFAAPVGVLLGGWVADRTSRHDLVAAGGLGLLAAAAFIVAATTPALPLVALLLGVAGLFIGLMAPSRDMLILSLTPPGHTGKAFGFVSSGLNLGGIVGPVTLGFVLDHAHPSWVFWITGLFSLMTLACVLALGRFRSSRG